MPITRWMRTVRYIVALSIFLAAVLGMLHIPAVQRTVFRLAAKQILESGGIQIEAGEFSYNLLRGHVQLQDLTFRTAAEGGNEPFARIPSISFRFNPLALGSGLGAVRVVRMDNPTIRVRVDEDGGTNLPVADSPRSFDWDSLPKEIHIGNGSLRIEDVRQGWILDFPRWNLEALKEENGLEWSFELRKQATVGIGSGSIPIERLRADGSIESPDLKIRSLQAQLGKNTLSAQGRILNLQDPSLDLHIRSQIDLAETSKILGMEATVAGNLDLEAGIAGPPGDIDLNASARYVDLQFADFDPVSGSFESSYSQRSSYLYVTDLRASSASGDVTATAALSLSEDESPSHLQADLSEINLERIMQIMGREQGLSGRASGSVECEWPGRNWRNAAIRGRLAIRGSGAGIPLNGSIDFGWDGQVAEIRSDNISGPGFHLRGNVKAEVSQQKVAGDTYGEIEDAAKMLRSMRASWPEMFSDVPEEIDGSVRWRMRLSGTRDAPRIRATVASGNLSIGDVTGIGMAGDLVYQSDRIEVEEIIVTLMEQNAHISGSLDTADAHAPIVKFRASMEDGSVHELLGGVGLDFPAEGRIDLDVEGTGPLADPEILVSFNIEDLEAWKEPLGNLKAGARFAGSQLTLDNFRLLKPREDGTGILEASGTLDWKEEIVRLRVRGEDIRFESMARSDESPFDGIFSLDANLDGPLSSPSWTLNLIGRDLSFMGINVGPVEGSLSGTGLRSVLDFEAPDLDISAGGDIRLSSPFPARLTLDAPRFDIDRVSQWLGDVISFTGSAAVHIEAEGPLARPEECTVNAVLHDLSIVASGQEIHTGSPMEAEWADGSLTLKPFTLASGEVELKASGRLPLNDDMADGAIHINGGMPLSAIFNLFPALRDFKPEGQVGIEGSIGGTLRRFRPRLDIYADNARLSVPGMATDLTDIAFRAGVDSSGMKLGRFEGRLADGSIRAEGTVPLPLILRAAQSTPASAVIDAENINPAVLFEGSNVPGGSISLRAVLESPDFDLKSLRGNLTFPELRLESGKTVAEQTGTTSFKIADGLLLVERFALSGPGTTLNVKGSVSLLENPTADLKVEGKLESGLLRKATDDFRLAGPIEAVLEIEGPLPDVRIKGSATLRNGRFALASPPISAEAVSVEAEFDDRIIRLKKAVGLLNGGDFEGYGELSYSKTGIDDVHAEFRAHNVFLDYPAGLQSVSNLDLRLRSESDFYILEGSAQILEGAHREVIDLRSLAQNAATPSPQEDAMLDRVRLNVRIQTESPVSVDNNLARVNAHADLRLAGTAKHPTLLGRLELEEGGQAYISQHVFYITRAIVRFTNEQRIEPWIDLSAETNIQDYLITFKASGGLKDLQASFTSDPPASRDQIQSLLITGSVDNAGKISGASLASQGALSLFGSTVVGGFNMRVRRVLGFSQFRIEPSLIAPDSDPTARLTIGQNFTPEFRITYSTSLSNSNDSIWIAEYDWRRDVLARYINRSEDTDRAEIRHRIRFGGGPGTGEIRRKRSERGYRLETLDIEGDTVFPESTVIKELGLKAGSRYDFSKIRNAVERLARYYAKMGYLEADVRQESRRENARLSLIIEIDPGPVLSLDFAGADVPKSLKKKIEKAWRDGLVENARLSQSSELILRHFIRKKYMDAEVSSETEYTGENEKTIHFTISPGSLYDKILWEFPGLPQPLAKDLESVLKKSKLDSGLEMDQAAISGTLSRHLRELGYLTSVVESPVVERNPDAGVFKTVVNIRPGPAYHLNDVIFEGNEAISSDILRKSLKLRRGEAYLPVRVGQWTRTIGDIYWRKGFREASLNVVEQPAPESGTLNLLFKIRENLQATVAEINIEGNVETSRNFLERRIPFSEGQEVDGEKLELLRRRLLNTGVYNTADIVLTPSAARDFSSDKTQPVDLNVQVKEPKPFSLEYGLTYDSERKVGFVADASMRNILGEGRTLGYRILAEREKLDQRIYFSQPFLHRSDITTTMDIGRENHLIDELEIEKSNFTIQQQVEFRRNFTLHYGYRLRRTESRLPTFSEVGDPEITSSLILALSRDTRNDIFDSSRGSYVSQSFEYGPNFLGGNLPYYRYYGQFFKYFGLSSPEEIPFAEERRPRFVFATGARVGLMDTLRAEVVSPGERFFGGGGSTVRGFRQNSLGPQLEDGQPVGGQALLFLNNELRMPVYKFVDAATFLDVGNVYDTVSDFSFSGVRASAGFGLRIRNPFILLRLDYGFKLNRREEESRGAFHFGIGQAF